MNQQNKTERWEEEYDNLLVDYGFGPKLPINTDNETDAVIKKFITQLLSDARREERERCLEAFPKKKHIGTDRWLINYDFERGFNEAITTAEESIRNSKDK